jgi:hypothetical protein
LVQPSWLPQSQDGRHTARSLNPHVIAPEGLADQAFFVLEGRTTTIYAAANRKNIPQNPPTPRS